MAKRKRTSTPKRRTSEHTKSKPIGDVFSSRVRKKREAARRLAEASASIASSIVERKKYRERKLPEHYHPPKPKVPTTSKKKKSRNFAAFTLVAGDESKKTKARVIRDVTPKTSFTDMKRGQSRTGNLALVKSARPHITKEGIGIARSRMCKQRPKNTASKGGGSRAYVPHCK